jgi:hypothetical protein
MCKIARCTFVPSNGGTASQDVSSNALVTFLLLSLPTDLASVQLERVVGVLVESWLSDEKDSPVPVANSSHILVDEWEWGAAEWRRPQPRRQ